MTKRPLVPRLRIAATLSLASLGLMVWSTFDPRPMPVIVAMSVGQVLGTGAFLAFVYVVYRDLRSRQRLSRADAEAVAEIAEKKRSPSGTNE